MRIAAAFAASFSRATLSSLESRGKLITSDSSGKSEPAERNSAQWDDVFADGAMFKHGNMGQGIYVDPARDFCGVNFAIGPNQGGIDWSPGYHRAAAKMLADG